MATYIEPLKQTLEARSFDKLSVTQWELVIVDLIAGEVLMHALATRQEPPEWTSEDRINAAFILRFDTRDTNPLGVAAMYFERSLSTRARQRFSQALARLVADRYHVFKANRLTKSPIIEHGLALSGYLKGVVNPLTLEKMALDTAFPYRTRALQNLATQTFRNSASPAFWDEIEAALPGAPCLLIPVMEHRLFARRPFDALRALGRLAEKPTNYQAIPWMIVEAIKEAFRYANGKEKLLEILPTMPPWVLELMREEQEGSAFLKEALALLRSPKRARSRKK